jgi:hypothetical protein
VRGGAGLGSAALLALQETLEGLSVQLRAEAEERDGAQRDMQTLQRQIKEEIESFEGEFEAKIAKASEEAAAPTRLEFVDRKAAQSESEALLLHLGSAEAHHGTLSINQERQLKHKSTKVSAARRFGVARGFHCTDDCRRCGI